jgi:nitrate/TMAO reductase-like tetraheme cytochrome c subunit
LNPANFSVFTCLNCHEHRQSAMDPQHAQVSGYAYSSPSCYNCHRGV